VIRRRIRCASRRATRAIRAAVGGATIRTRRAALRRALIRWILRRATTRARMILPRVVVRSMRAARRPAGSTRSRAAAHRARRVIRPTAWLRTTFLATSAARVC